MDIALDPIFQRKAGDLFDAFNVGWIKRFIWCGKITDSPQVEDPVYVAFEQARNCFRRSKNDMSFLGRAVALTRTPFWTRNSTR
jgi:hypothetical protein